MAELAPLLIKAVREQEAARYFAESQAAQVASNWPGMIKSLAEVENRHETATYRLHEAEIKDLRWKLDAALQKQGEDIAKQMYITACANYDAGINEKRYDDAAQVMRTYSQNHIATRYYDSKKTEIDQKIAEAARRKATHHDDEARVHWTKLQKDMKSNSYESALEELSKLTGEYADTPTFRSNEAKIRQYKATAEQNAALPEYVLVTLEFEDHPGFWNARGGATATNTDEPYQGKRAARLTLPGGSAAEHPIHGITAKADTLSFWARSTRKGPAALVVMWLSDGQGSYSKDFQIDSEWKLYSAHLTEFKNNAPAAKIRTIQAFEKINWFGFQPINNAASCEIQIDSLRVEAPRR
jgi:hypothetical protein